MASMRGAALDPFNAIKVMFERDQAIRS
jgi:hypothetical protein